MADRIIALTSEILNLTKEQGIKLAADEIDELNKLLDKREALLAQLGELLEGNKLPLAAKKNLEEAMKLSDEQSKNATKKKSELTLEFNNAKRSYESIEAYEQSSMDYSGAIGAMYDRNT